jgi:hypothetical protein
MKARALLALGLVAMLLTGCFTVNSDIEVGAGERVERPLSTVNGRVRIGEGANVERSTTTVNGGVGIGARASVASVETVNGKIVLGPDAQAESLATVNGAIQIEAGARVSGDVEAVNGRVVIEAGAEVDGKVASVNGQLWLKGARAGSLENVAGGMILESDSVVSGELRVRKPRGGKTEPVTVVIHARAQVEGPLVFEREVKLQVHRDAVIGRVEGATVEFFDD